MYLAQVTKEKETVCLVNVQYEGDNRDLVLNGTPDLPGIQFSLALNRAERIGLIRTQVPTGWKDLEASPRAGSVLGRSLRRALDLLAPSGRQRDMLMLGMPNLASCADSDNRPTSGVRLEIPRELGATFRLLLRFGTRLQAQHGEGTKRHIKLDDYEASF